jgi:hypothetical protein
MQQGRGGAAIMTSLLPMAFGAFLAIAGIVGGSRRDVIIGLALVATGLVGLVAPRLVPPPPGLSREQLRARRTAIVILPNGIIYVALGVLLVVVLPASERDGPTVLITIFALGMGTLSILSGLGALARARRPDGTPRRDGAAGSEKRGEA